MKKIAILFPGVGYTTNHPLFYYVRKILKNNGFEIAEVSYDGEECAAIMNEIKDKGINADILHKKVVDFAAKTVERCEKQLSGIDFSEYGNIFFVSKSIGSVISSAIAEKNKLNVSHVFFTPLEFAFQLSKNIRGVAFCGANDPIVGIDSIAKCCKGANVDCYTIFGANHSLETGDINVDIKALANITADVSFYVTNQNKTVYDFSVENRGGGETELSKFKGKVLLIVNTATGCGFTPQYRELEDMYKRYNKMGFEILDFPCNQFQNQAPGSAEEIHSFCVARYDIHFEQFAKIHVNGEKEIPLYTYLKSQKGFAGFDKSTQSGRFLDRKLRETDENYENSSDIKWNFTKFLVDRNGHVAERYEPLSDLKIIEKDVAALLDISED